MVDEKPTILAAQYLRMSTDMQATSLDNQADAIAAYAAERKIRVVRSYVDAGCSGLTESREGLQSLIRDVEAGDIDFSAVLVYDVSRWGRFQDIDAAAYYEYLCRKAGVAVVYCLDRFENDGSPLSGIVKTLKRIMAAEYSRDLSEKVIQAQFRRARAGCRLGGTAPYGFRRVLLDPDGRRIGQLKSGQRSPRGGCSVTLEHGPPHELEAIRLIYAMYIERGLSRRRIAQQLNARKVMPRLRKKWSAHDVDRILANQVYCGTMVYNRTTQRFKTKSRPNPEAEWIVVPDAVPAIVSPEQYRAARAVKVREAVRITTGEALDKLKRLYATHGYLSMELINAAPDMPLSAYYADHWSSLRNAFLEVGFANSGRLAEFGVHEIRRYYRGMVGGALLDLFAKRGVPARGRQGGGSVVAGEVTFKFYVLSHRVHRRSGRSYWLASLPRGALGDVTLFARLEPGNEFIFDYWVARSRLIKWQNKRLPQENYPNSEFRVLATLEQLPDFVWG